MNKNKKVCLKKIQIFKEITLKFKINKTMKMLKSSLKFVNKNFKNRFN